MSTPVQQYTENIQSNNKTKCISKYIEFKKNCVNIFGNKKINTEYCKILLNNYIECMDNDSFNITDKQSLR